MAEGVAKSMKRILRWMLAALCAASLLTGCGDASPRRTTIEVKKNGRITHTIVEDFAENYYSLDALKEMIQTACDTYNTTMSGDLVRLKEAKEEDGVLTAVMEYESAAAYSGFNRQALFIGTVKEAKAAGYDLNVTLTDAGKDGGTVGKAELLEKEDSHILVIREAVDVRVWDKVLCYSDDVTPQDDGSLTVSDDQTLSFIVFK